MRSMSIFNKLSGLVFSFGLACGFVLILHWPVYAAVPPHWRYWLPADGLGESCSNSVYTGPSGAVWVNHGHIQQMSRLDGYSVCLLPSPGVGVPVYESASGVLWSICEDGFLKFTHEGDWSAGEWKRFSVEEIDPNRTPFFPIRDGLILYVHSSNILSFDAVSGKVAIVKDLYETEMVGFYCMIPARGGGVWIGGKGILAKLDISAENSSNYTWHEYALNNEFKEYKIISLTEGDCGAVFAVVAAGNGIERFLLKYSGGGWEILYKDTSGTLEQGWGGIDGCHWLFQSPFSLTAVEGERMISTGQNKVLSRVLLDVCIEEKGVFWLATGEGLARYAPAVWRPPSGAPEKATLVHGMLEDPQGRVWFAFADALVCHEKDEWRSYPLPAEHILEELKAEPVCILPGGCIAVKTQAGLFSFDPASGIYTPIEHPRNQTISLIAAREDGTIWTVSHGNGETALDIFDGRAFETVLQIRDDAILDTTLRHVLEDREGNLWFGGLNGLTRWRNGEWKVFGPEDGFIETSVNCIHQREDGAIWIGGRDSIMEFKAGRWRTIRTGLDMTRGIRTTRDGSVWAASGTGLHRYSDGSWVTHTWREGLPDAAVYDVFEDSQGRLWAGTTSGLSLYHHEADLDPPQTIMPEGANSKEYAPGGAQFFFTGIDQWKYTPRDRLLFSFRIDDRDWSPFQEDTVAVIPRLVRWRAYILRKGDGSELECRSFTGNICLHHIDPLVSTTFVYLDSCRGNTRVDNIDWIPHIASPQSGKTRPDSNRSIYRRRMNNYIKTRWI